MFSSLPLPESSPPPSPPSSPPPLPARTPFSSPPSSPPSSPSSSLPPLPEYLLGGLSSGTYASYENAFSSEHQYENLLSTLPSLIHDPTIPSSNPSSCVTDLTFLFKQLNHTLQSMIDKTLTPDSTIQRTIGTLITTQESFQEVVSSSVARPSVPSQYVSTL